MTYSEALRIVRGYRRRNRLQHQLLAEIVYTTMYAMRDPKGKTVSDMFPQLFETDNDEEEDISITEDEIIELRGLIYDINSHNREAGI